MLAELLQFFFNLFKRKKGIAEDLEFKMYYNDLVSENYEAHIDYNLLPENVLNDNLPSDCEDRANALANKALKLGYTPLMLGMQWPTSGHLAVYIEKRVFDPTHDFYNVLLKDYLDKEKPAYHYLYPYAGPGFKTK